MRKKQMSSRVSNLKRRKEKCAVPSSDRNLKVKGSDKSSVKRMDVKKMEDSKTEIPLNDCMVGGCMESTTTSERLICDGYKWDEKTRTNVLPENMEGDETEASVVIDKSIFLDDDSNQVLPVEKFFGNMEVVQDCPQRSAASLTFSRREHRRRQYYAKEDSDEEGYTDMQQEDINGT
ncbi:unnamed protein product [Oncorhynchus mykiss]|uniref:Uncharacterized protein n=1 Tax=Oncorhynchus mykiss TaxID=8022 RepID=A0A060VW82_ONCMY|nr:unnamed protein product [Oncorhynchus mykiss]